MGGRLEQREIANHRQVAGGQFPGTLVAPRKIGESAESMVNVTGFCGLKGFTSRYGATPSPLKRKLLVGYLDVHHGFVWG